MTDNDSPRAPSAVAKRLADGPVTQWWRERSSLADGPVTQWWRERSSLTDLRDRVALLVDDLRTEARGAPADHGDLHRYLDEADVAEGSLDARVRELVEQRDARVRELVEQRDSWRSRVLDSHKEARAARNNAQAWRAFAVEAEREGIDSYDAASEDGARYALHLATLCPPLQLPEDAPLAPDTLAFVQGVITTYVKVALVIMASRLRCRAHRPSPRLYTPPPSPEAPDGVSSGSDEHEPTTSGDGADSPSDLEDLLLEQLAAQGQTPPGIWLGQLSNDEDGERHWVEIENEKPSINPPSGFPDEPSAARAALEWGRTISRWWRDQMNRYPVVLENEGPERELDGFDTAVGRISLRRTRSQWLVYLNDQEVCCTNSERVASSYYEGATMMAPVVSPPEDDSSSHTLAARLATWLSGS